MSFIIFPTFQALITSPQHVLLQISVLLPPDVFQKFLILFINFGRLKSGNKSQAAKPKKRKKEKKLINEAINYRFCLEVEGVLCCFFLIPGYTSLLSGTFSGGVLASKVLKMSKTVSGKDEPSFFYQKMFF